MDIPQEWLQPKSMQEAIEVQNLLAKKIVREDAFGTLSLLAGMDVSNFLYDPKKMIYAACVLVGSADLQLQEQAAVAEKQLFPYIPGLLGFREAPSLISAYSALKKRPDLIMVDGHGISHPRAFGIASHVGVLLDLPSIGVAKSILVGKPQGPLGAARGSTTPLIYKGKIIGMMVRTKNNCNPLIVSTGHRVSLETSVALVLQASAGYRVPEPTRQAHLAANAARRNTIN